MGLSWRRSAKKKEQELSGGFQHYALVLKSFTEKEVVQICLMEELQSGAYGEQPEAKKSVKLRSIYTVVYSATVGVCLWKFYFTGSLAWLLSLATLIYVLLMIRASTLSVLYKQAEKEPTKDFAQVVRENVPEPGQNPGKKSVVGGMAILAAVLVSFVLFNSKESWRFEPYEDGCAVVAYRPGLLNSGTVTVPKYGEGKQVLAISKQAFVGNNTVEQLLLPEGLLSIGSGAFKNCKNLKTVTLPESLTELLGEAFMGCSFLEEIRIPTGVTAIRGNTFDGCSSLRKVELHNGIQVIHAFAFRGCKELESIELPPDITEIREQTFAQCSELRSITIPEGVVKIGNRAFYACSKLHTVDVPDSVQEIRGSAFRECSALETISIFKGTEVADSAFQDSPTEVKERLLTQAQWKRVLEELEENGYGDQVYYVYSKEKGADQIYPKLGSKTILLSNDIRLQEQLNSGEAMKEMTWEQVAELLEKAKKDGMETVKIAWYSQVGSDILGRDYFPASTWELDELLQELR